MRLLGRATAAAAAAVSARSVKAPRYHGWTRTSHSSCSGVRDAEDRLRAALTHLQETTFEASTGPGGSWPR